MEADPVIDEKRRADAPAPLASPKRIIAFSDGTGNSSSNLFRTNVWRLYDALDLGDSSKLSKEASAVASAANPATGQTNGQADAVAANVTQIAYYDNGVGTSSIRFLAVLGGVFGFGLKRNLLDLYKYVCRNYNDSYADCDGKDSIYAFGFSRGAFTIRLLVALICTQGIMPYEDERELHRNCSDALRRFLSANAPDNFPWLFQSVRWARDVAITGWRKFRGQRCDTPAAAWPDIEFVGVWDTVSAYGGPIIELTRGIDQYVWPLSMTNYALHPKVKIARHALALDDERDSFWPLLWDELAEDYGARGRTDPPWTDEQRARAGSRLKQVWFAGMHSDVGGGYPDDSLAYVSLQWMIEQIDELAPDKQLKLLAMEKRRISSFANPLGPMHDSRQGLAGFYRYQPRKIAAMLHRSIADTVGMNQTRVLRDPTIGEKRHRPQGLLKSCVVHRSVIERIAVGNDNFAPIGLPRKFEIDPPFAETDTSPLAKAARNIAQRDIAKARGEIQENGWDLVWMRRVGYLLVVAIVALLATAPLWTDDDASVPQTDSRWVVDDLFLLIRGVVPDFAGPWYDALTHYWPTTFALMAIAVLLTNAMTQLQSALGDRIRVTWWDAVDGQPIDKVEPTALRTVRNSILYQALLQFWKWRVLPFVCGLGILALVPWTVLVVWTQTSLVSMESSFRTRDVSPKLGALCADPQKDSFDTAVLEQAPSAPLTLEAAQPCSDWFTASDHPGVPLQVVKGERYLVVIEDPRAEGWLDKSYPVKLGGQGSSDYGWPATPIMVGAVPLRRVVTANWLEPLVEIRSVKLDEHWSNSDRRTVQIERLEPIRPTAGHNQPKPHRYIGAFTAHMDGTIHVFLNDAMLPLGLGNPTAFYENNPDLPRNQKTMQIWRADQLDDAIASCQKKQMILWVPALSKDLRCDGSRQAGPSPAATRRP